MLLVLLTSPPFFLFSLRSFLILVLHLLYVTLHFTVLKFHILDEPLKYIRIMRWYAHLTALASHQSHLLSLLYTFSCHAIYPDITYTFSIAQYRLPYVLSFYYLSSQFFSHSTALLMLYLVFSLSLSLFLAYLLQYYRYKN